ncbi:MAG TPA: rhamnogalacturonan acetylesterase [Opitutaceae bacterium]|nr:rhamnogalacturonan acetylesterase [Opitutaceae bacterium]
MHAPTRLIAAALLCAGSAIAAPTNVSLKFDFGPGPVAPGYTQVLPDMSCTSARGYGFEPGAKVEGVDRGGPDALREDFVTSDHPFDFTARVPHEGNYRVTVTLGDAHRESTTCIKAELRRLMVKVRHTAPGEFATVSFIVNTRVPTINAVEGIKAGVVRLKAPRETTMEAWDWDDAITLEFNDVHPAVCAVEIEPVEVPTIYVLGDSTVCDQPREPYTSWGQMLTAFFKPEVAVANHAESGETYRDSIGRRRLDKIASLLQPGDWVLMQFGHNDQKQIAAHTGGPFTTYIQEIKRHVEEIRAHGGNPVIVSSMERRRFDEKGKLVPSLTEYAEASRKAAEEFHVPFIDLNAMSIRFYEALGPKRSAVAFAAPNGRVDNTHHDNYGAYQLAQCIVEAIREQHLAIAKYIVDDFKGFDPSHPDDPDTFDIPPSGEYTNQRPLGD